MKVAIHPSGLIVKDGIPTTKESRIEYGKKVILGVDRASGKVPT